MTKHPTHQEQAQSPQFIPLTQAQLDAGLDDATIQLLRSVLNIEAFERDLGRLIAENPQPEVLDKAA